MPHLCSFRFLTVVYTAMMQASSSNVCTAAVYIIPEIHLLKLLLLKAFPGVAHGMVYLSQSHVCTTLEFL